MFTAFFRTDPYLFSPSLSANNTLTLSWKGFPLTPFLPFSNCIHSDIMAVLFCLTTFRRKIVYYYFNLSNFAVVGLWKSHFWLFYNFSIFFSDASENCDTKSLRWAINAPFSAKIELARTFPVSPLSATPTRAKRRSSKRWRARANWCRKISCSLHWTWQITAQNFLAIWALIFWIP